MGTEPTNGMISAALKKVLSENECCAFIFGSRADGTAGYNSDWDIGIIPKRSIRGAKMEKARDELEKIRTLHRFELVDFSKTSPEFREIALKHILPLFGN